MAPAQDVLSYEVVKFNSAFGVGRSEYQGEPSAKLDELWENLFLLELQIPREQARLLPNKTIPVHPDKPDSFAVGLSAAPALSANGNAHRETEHDPQGAGLLQLPDVERNAQPSQHAPPSPGRRPPPRGPLDPPHLSHCIDHLRQAIQCHSDISPVVWQWSEATQDNKIYGTTVRTCRNFAAVRAWATEHDYSKMIYSPEKPEELGLCGAFDQGCGY
ncbi:hypothetical protein PG995_010561 [Apiospora arundinis]